MLMNISDDSIASIFMTEPEQGHRHIIQNLKGQDRAVQWKPLSFERAVFQIRDREEEAKIEAAEEIMKYTRSC